MADNYLERKMEEYLAQPAGGRSKPIATLTRLLRRNRSCWGSIYENDLKYYHTLAQNAARPKPLWRKILKI